MISIDEAREIFEEQNPELTITKIVDYDNQSYVLCAVKDPDNSFDEMDPFYSVDKRTKEISWFSPMLDLEKFSRMMLG